MFRNKTLQGRCYVAVLPLDSLHQFLWCQEEALNLAFAACSLYGLWGRGVGSWSSKRLDALLSVLGLDMKHQHRCSSLDPAASLMSLSLALDRWLLVEVLVGVVSSPCPPPTRSPGGTPASASAGWPKAGRTCRHWVPPAYSLSRSGPRAEAVAEVGVTKYRSLMPTKYHGLICFRGTFLCRWLRAQLLIPGTAGSSEVAFPSLAHADPLFQCWGTSWPPETDGAASRSACAAARGRQQARAPIR